MHHIKRLSKAPYLVVIAILIGLLANNVFATRFENNGVPAELMAAIVATQERVDAVADQVDGVAHQVHAMSTYIDNNTAATGEATAQLCLNASVGVGINAGGQVEPLLELGLATGLDVYGLIDLDAGVGINAKAILSALVNAGIDVTGTICVNVGVANTTNFTTPIAGDNNNDASLVAANVGNLEVPEGMDELVEQSREALFGLFAELPELMDEVPLSLGDVRTSVNTLIDTVSSPEDFVTTTLLRPNAWLDALEGLPGHDMLASRYHALTDTIEALASGDVCNYLDGLAPVVGGGVADFATATCGILPSGFNATIGFAEDVVDDVWGLFKDVRDLLDEVDEVRHIVNGIESVTDAICSTVGC